MKLIVGLGNPGKDYEKTRHNVGFELVDRLAEKWSVDIRREKFQSLFGDTTRKGRRVILLKPQTYMNLSGQSVQPAAAFYKVATPDILVVFDDMALPLGTLRLRANGSAGGHNGIKDILARLGTNEFHRLRLGIGAAHPGGAVGHVLGRFAAEERDVLDDALNRAVKAVECWLDLGMEKAMSRFNTRQNKKKRPRDEQAGSDSAKPKSGPAEGAELQ